MQYGGESRTPGQHIPPWKQEIQQVEAVLLNLEHAYTADIAKMKV